MQEVGRSKGLLAGMRAVTFKSEGETLDLSASSVKPLKTKKPRASKLLPQLQLWLTSLLPKSELR